MHNEDSLAGHALSSRRGKAEKKYTGEDAAKGTKVGGYEEHGPYHCEDCIHQTDGFCEHPAIMSDPELKGRRNQDGLVKINLEHGCCEYVNQPKPKQDDEDNDE
jgi:hypothetical protein